MADAGTCPKRPGKPHRYVGDYCGDCGDRKSPLTSLRAELDAMTERVVQLETRIAKLEAEDAGGEVT